MTDQIPDAGQSPADAELADAMNSIEATGEDWRSSERGVENEPAEGQKNG